MKKCFWVIERYEGTKLISQHTIPNGQITEENLKNLLRTLVAKYELTDEEIIPCFLKKNTKRYWDYLEVQKDSKAKFYTLYCQGNLNVLAMSIPEDKLSDIQEKNMTEMC